MGGSRYSNTTCTLFWLATTGTIVRLPVNTLESITTNIGSFMGSLKYISQVANLNHLHCRRRRGIISWALCRGLTKWLIGSIFLSLRSCFLGHARFHSDEGWKVKLILGYISIINRPMTLNSQWNFCQWTQSNKVTFLFTHQMPIGLNESAFDQSHMWKAPSLVSF